MPAFWPHSSMETNVRLSKQVNSPIDKNICFGYDKEKKPVWFGTVGFFL